MGYDSGFISGVNEPDTHYSCRIREEAERERAEAAEHKLARVVEELNGIGPHHKSWNPSAERASGWNDCRELVREIVATATGEGK